VEAPITRICNWLAGIALTALAAAPAASAIRVAAADPARTYVEARAAAMAGEHARAAALLASLAAADPGQSDLAQKALAEALGAGQMDLALSLARTIPSAKLTSEARLLLAGDEIRLRRPEQAVRWLSANSENGDLSFLTPMITAWSAADRGDIANALATLDQVPAGSLLASLVPEQRAFILIKARRTAEAEPLARQAVGAAGEREDRLRLAFADGFLGAGDKQRALMIVEGMGAGEAAARQRIMAGTSAGEVIDSLPKAYADALGALAADIARLPRAVPPVGLVQVARYLNPQDSANTALLALLLSSENRDEEALAVLRSVPADDPLISRIRDVQTRILTGAKRYDEAYRIAASAAASATADASDYSRLGDVLEAMKRYGAAADAYGRAISVGQAQQLKGELWTLYLLRASALEDAGRWPEARAALQQGLALQPDQPLLLNFMGYAQLERGENVDSAEAMIRKASALAPDDASITDSLGWAQFKRGKMADAIATLQRAAEKDPDQAEIQEHLGDALFKSGRRFEARFAWSAALVTAEEDTAARVKAKLVSGLTAANAAP
jgi:tetratricopeptide (TPR) repeat protein